MASLYNADIQRDAALLVFGRQNSELSDNEKVALDNTWTSGTPKGAAGHAQAEIERYGNFLHASGLDDMPSDWAGWFVYEVGVRLAPRYAPSLVGEIRTMRDDFKSAALSTFSRIASNYTTDSDEQNEKTWLGIRRAVMANCVNQRSGPVFAAPELIDGAIRWALHELWNEAEWSWQTLTDKTFTIANAGGKLQQIDVTPDIRSIRSMRLWYDSTVAAERSWMQYISADEMSRLQAERLDDGQPDCFRIVRSGRELQIQLERTPDKTYTLRGEFVRRCPDIGALESAGYGVGEDNFDDILALIPDEFIDVIEMLALGRVLSARGLREGRVIAADAKAELESLVERDERGEPLKEYARNRSNDLVEESILQSGGGAAGGEV